MYIAMLLVLTHYLSRLDRKEHQKQYQSSKQFQKFQHSEKFLSLILL